MNDPQFFVELILHWTASSLRHLFSGTSSLSSHLSGPLLLWPASQLPLLLHCSFCNPILLFAQLVQCVYKPPAAIPHSARVALWSITTFCAAVTLRLATSSCNPACQERRSITHALLRAAEKTQDFAPESVFTRAFARFRTVTLPNYLMMGGWHDDVVDMMMGMLTMKVFRNSNVFQLNFLRSQVITIVLLVKMPLAHPWWFPGLATTTHCIHCPAQELDLLWSHRHLATSAVWTSCPLDVRWPWQFLCPYQIFGTLGTLWVSSLFAGDVSIW